MIYKILARSEWEAAAAAGRYDGSEVDRRDGYIHLSAADQVAETAALHFAGLTDLVVLAIDPEKVGASLRWEPSRGGALFPHVYGPLPIAAVASARPLPRASAISELLAEDC